MNVIRLLIPAPENRLSFFCLIGCYLLMCYVAFCFYPRWNKTQSEATFGWDVSGYYQYLPALFIYQDLKHCAYLDSVIIQYRFAPKMQQAHTHPLTGNCVFKYPSGLALTMLPFFLAGHAYALFSRSAPADGFSFPYQFAIGAGMFLYSLLGVFLLRLLLLRYFSDRVVALILLAYVAGTNYLNYAAVDQAMTHSVLFTIYCLLMLLTEKFHQSPKPSLAAGLGLLVGLATLIRPTEIISALIPVLWNINSLADAKAKWKFLLAHFSKYLLAALMAFAVFSVQMMYWKYVTHKWLYYSYQDQGFDWFRPKVWEFTFNYGTGWLRHTPMMLLPLLGLLLFLFKGQQRTAVLVFLLLFFYLATAWQQWHYGGLSGRAMVQSYPLWAFPFGVLMETMMRRKWSAWLLALLLLLFIYQNLWWTYFAHRPGILVSGASKTYYWKTLGRWHTDEEDLKWLDNKHVFRGTPTDSVLIYYNDFSNDTSKNCLRVGDQVFIRVNRQMPKTAAYAVPRPQAVHEWIRARADFSAASKEWDVWKQSQFIVQFVYNSDTVQTNFIRVDRFLNEGQWRTLHLDARVPDKPWNRLLVLIRNFGSDKEVQIDNLEVIMFSP